MLSVYDISTYRYVVVFERFGRLRFARATTPVEAATAAQATTTARGAEAEYHQELAPLAVSQQIGLEVLLAELFGQLEAHTSILIVYLSLGFIAEYRICMIYLLELQQQK